MASRPPTAELQPPASLELDDIGSQSFLAGGDSGWQGVEHRGSHGAIVPSSPPQSQTGAAKVRCDMSKTLSSAKPTSMFSSSLMMRPLSCSRGGASGSATPTPTGGSHSLGSVAGSNHNCLIDSDGAHETGSFLHARVEGDNRSPSELLSSSSRLLSRSRELQSPSDGLCRSSLPHADAKTPERLVSPAGRSNRPLSRPEVRETTGRRQSAEQLPAPAKMRDSVVELEEGGEMAPTSLRTINILKLCDDGIGVLASAVGCGL